MLDDAQLVAFAASTDLERSKAFYGGVLGLPVAEDSPYAAVFRAPNALLRVTAVEEHARAPYTVLGWDVDDITARVRMLAAAGVTFHRYDGMGQDDDGVWTAPGGAQVAWFADPDGNTLSLTQHP